MEKKSLIILISIVALGAILRFAFLEWNPPSLNWDEISHGYNAYSILRTGMDQWGQKFPVFNFRAYGDYPTTLNLYLTIPFIAVFGLTEFAIRFPHALLGVFSLISVYFMVFGLTRKRDLSLLATFLASTGPWYVFTSRFVLQSNLAVFFLITAGAFYLNRERHKLFLPLSFLSLFLTLFSYHTTRILSPLLIIGSVLIYKSEIKNKLIYLFAGLFVALSVYILVSPNAAARGNLLFIIDQSAVNGIDSLRSGSKLPALVTKIVYNRPVYFVEQFSKNYISYFSPRFLFLDGGTQYQFSIPGFGLIYPVWLPFFYIGLILVVFKAIKDKNYRFVLLWLLLAPVPASLTNESYAVIRATTLLPIPEILISIGLITVVDKFIRKDKDLVIAVMILVTLIFLGKYLHAYFMSYRANYSWSWQYGYEQAVDYAGVHYNDYDKIIMTKKYGEPHEYFLFFLKYDPEKYLSDPNKISFYQSNWWWVDHFDKFWFVNDWQVKNLVTESKIKIDCLKLKCLLISSPGNAPTGWNKINTVNFLDGSRAFDIYNNE